MEEDKLIKVDLEERTMTLLEMTKFKKQIPFFTFELTKEEKAINENDP